MHVLHTVWHRIVIRQPAPDRLVVGGAALIALIAVVSQAGWWLTRHPITLAHEAAHGFVAALGGRRLAGIRLHHDGSGLTLSRGRPDGPGMVAMLAAGYLGPAVIGVVAAAVLASGHAVGLLWAMLVLLALLLLQIRNLFGLWSVVVTGAAVFAVSWWLPGRWQTAFAAFATWLLLLGAPRPVLNLARRRPGRRGGGQRSDPEQLAGITPLPAGAWVALLLLATVAALVGGAALLLHRS